MLNSSLGGLKLGQKDGEYGYFTGEGADTFCPFKSGLNFKRVLTNATGACDKSLVSGQGIATEFDPNYITSDIVITNVSASRYDATLFQVIGYRNNNYRNCTYLISDYISSDFKNYTIPLSTIKSWANSYDTIALGIAFGWDGANYSMTIETTLET